MLSFTDSPFEFLLLCPSRFVLKSLCFGLQRCRPICKCEPYCLCKKSPHFINQQVITFQSFWDLISPHWKNAVKCILLYFSKLKFHRVRRTFPVRLQWVFIFFCWNVGRMVPDNVAKRGVRKFLFFASFQSDEYLSKANVWFIKT